MYHNRAVELLLEYGPDWRTDMLHDIHTSCSDMFQYPVFCRDGVFWSCKLLLAAVSQVLTKKSLQNKTNNYWSMF